MSQQTTGSGVGATIRWALANWLLAAAATVAPRDAAFIAALSVGAKRGSERVREITNGWR